MGYRLDFLVPEGKLNLHESNEKRSRAAKRARLAKSDIAAAIAQQAILYRGIEPALADMAGPAQRWVWRCHWRIFHAANRERREQTEFVARFESISTGGILAVMKRRFAMWPITRRATLRMSLSAAISGFSPSWKTSAQPGISDELHARFLQWSRTATGFADLTPDTARACLELLLRSGISPQALSNLGPNAYDGTPIEKQLLEAWYTGIFRLDGLRGVRSYATTLMWRAAGIDPPPSTCNGGPKRWASAPSDV